EHSLLVVARRCGRARDEHDLAAVAVDVRLEEGDLVPIGRVLDDGHALLERVGRDYGPFVSKELLDAAELDEGDRDRPMLRLALLEQQVLADRDRQAPRKVERIDAADGLRAGTFNVGLPPEEDRVVL